MRIARVLLYTLICLSAAVAQTNKGGISGTVFDKSGAVIAAASVPVLPVGVAATVSFFLVGFTASAPVLRQPVPAKARIGAQARSSRQLIGCPRRQCP